MSPNRRPVCVIVSMLEVPPNFGMVAQDIYRCSFPRPEHFQLLSTLNLKSVVCLISEPYPEENVAFLDSNDIKLFQFGLSGNKEPFANMEMNYLYQALLVILDKKNHPILIHCNQGKHRTGCLVGCFRRAQDWSLSIIFDEYRRYAFPKVRPLDQLTIELFQVDEEVCEKARHVQY